MESRKKRALLARIEGQLAMITRDEGSSRLRWQRVKWALNTLQVLPRDANESSYSAQLQRHLMMLAGEHKENAARSLLVHRLTLARADCVIWQLYLRHGTARVPGC
ncbi:MAG TPA: hypothetical protein VF275_13005 [Gammaproteobacteria bacterium]